MKKVLLVTLVLVMFTLFSHAQGYENKKLGFTLGGGISIPIGSMADQQLLGFNLVAGINFEVMNNLDLFVDFQGNLFPLDEYSVIYPDESVTGGTFTSMTLSSGFRIKSSPGPIVLYGLVGIGLGINSMSDMTIYGDGYTEYWSFESEIALAMLAGAGLEIELSPGLSFLLEVRFVNAFTEGESTSFMPALAGFLIRI